MMLANAIMDHLAWAEGDAGCNWLDMVATRLKERPITFEVKMDTGTRADRKLRERELAREIAATTTDQAERLRLWSEQTGKIERTLYRRLTEIGEA